MIYHAMQLRVERRSATGVTLLTSYVWGKEIDTMNRITAMQNAYNRNVERGPGLEDARHRLMVSMVYPLPIGSGTSFLGSVPVVNSILGGWQISGIVRVNSGSPLTPILSKDVSGTGRLVDRPNLIGPVNDGPKTKLAWWNKAGLQIQSSGFGNAGQGILTGPGWFTTDLSLARRFHMGEHREMQVRFEAFNALNHTNFNNPNTTADSSSFGTIGSANPSRQLQLGAKFNF